MPDEKLDQPPAPPELIDRAFKIPAVAEALRVYEQASARAPFTPRVVADVRYVTGTNG